MNIFQDLKTRAGAELEALKADARSAEVRIEEAFHLGAVHAALASIEKTEQALAEKLKAAFDLGKQQQAQ